MFFFSILQHHQGRFLKQKFDFFEVFFHGRIFTPDFFKCPSSQEFCLAYLCYGSISDFLDVFWLVRHPRIDVLFLVSAFFSRQHCWP